jgi:hypothetical protein
VVSETVSAAAAFCVGGSQPNGSNNAKKVSQNSLQRAAIRISSYASNTKPSNGNYRSFDRELNRDETKNQNHSSQAGTS